MNEAKKEENMSKLMGKPVFHELTKQASFFIKEKIKTARLAVTDVTSEELLTEEVTSSAQSPIDARSLRIITKASFEIDQFQRIVNVLRKRMLMFERKELWGELHNTLIILEHLLVNGPLSIAKEFDEMRVLLENVNEECIDEKVRKIGERVMRLFQDETFFKEERERKRKEHVDHNQYNTCKLLFSSSTI